MKLLKILKKQLLTILIYIFLFEALFQFLFIFDFKFIKQPILFYNGYCDQRYWNFNDQEKKFDMDVLSHPILSFQKKGIFIPKKFENDALLKIAEFSKKEISLYGSSYINHSEVKNIIGNFQDIYTINYALGSYGLDQIYLNYKLTAHLNQNKTIVFGFLLEDLDRSIFNYREYQKALFVWENNKFNLKNVPIKQNINAKKSNDFYLFRFLSNFYHLITNDFDPRLSKCKINYKKELSRYFFEDIQKSAKKFNQRIIVITFNLKEDLEKKPSWRYDFIKNLLTEKNITHIDALQIMINKSDEYDEKIENYFGSDAHNNKKSFEYIFDEFLRIYKAI